MTLLQDVTLASTLFVGDWDGNYPLTVIFNGGDHTVTGKPGDPIFDVTRVGTLTINSGTFQTQVAASGNDYGCVSVTNGGTATITGGTFRQGESAAFMRGCVDVNYGGTATISGGAFESEGTDGYALYARLGSTTHLSGGTFKGNNPVVCEVRSDIQGRLFLKDLLLNSASASGQHYAFYQNGRPCDSSGTTLPAGTVTVKECTHEGAPVENLGGGTYRVDCPYCGHSYTYTTATPLTEDMVTLSETEVAYTGKPLTPDVTVTGLTAGTDYTVSYSNNTERGTATVTVTGMGKYTGKITKTFTIVYARLTKDVMLGAVSRPYEPGNRTVSLTSVSGVSKEAPEIAVSTELPSGTVGILSGEDAGTYETVILAKDTITEDGDYIVPAGEYQVFVGQTPGVEITKATYTGTKNAIAYAKFGTTGAYDLSALLPEGAVLGTPSIQTDEDGIFVADSLSVAGTRLQYTLKDTATAGQTGTITVPVESSTNYQPFELHISVSVVGKVVPVLTIDPITVTYTGDPVPVSAIRGTAKVDGKTVDGTWIFQSAPVNVADSGVKVVRFDPTDRENYEVALGTVQVTINKATPAGAPTYTAISTAGKTLSDGGLTAPEGWPAGTLEWTQAGTTEVTANTAYGWLFTPDDTANYNTLTGKITLWVRNTGGGNTGSGSSSGDGGTYTPPTYTPDVTRPGEGGGTPSVSPSRPERGDTVTVIPRPDEGYEVDEIIVTDRAGRPVEVTKKPDGTYAFTQPSGTVTIEVIYKAVPPVDQPWNNPFADVSEGAWYSEAVRFVEENGLMTGYEDGRFGAEDTLSRAQLAQILHNKEGRPGVNYLLTFNDVAGEAWYTEAIRWAASQGIVSGYGDGMFGPDDPITREQLAVMLWRYAGSPDAANQELNFTDADEISGFTLEAMRWAVENGILSGYGDGRLDPKGQATRAQVAAMLMRYLGK